MIIYKHIFMILSETKYNSFKEEVKMLSQKYDAVGIQFVNWIDNCGFETNPNRYKTFESVELTNEIILLLDEKYNSFKVILNKLT